MYKTLIDPETLAQHLDDPAWIVIDCRFQLADTEAGRRAYAVGHIPGARYAHLDEDLSSAITATTGRHPLPAPEAMTERLRQWGVNRDSQVVAYDDAGGAIASRLWWLLRWLGHERVALLDGGMEAWEAVGEEFEIGEPAVKPGNFTARVDAGAALMAADVERIVAGERAGLVLDARAAPRYRGDEEPLDKVAGHIPSSVNLPFGGNLGPDGRFLEPDALRARFEAVLAGQAPGDVVHSCGSGVTACHNLLAMEHAGLSGSRLYPGSWSEWITDPARPVASGEKP